MTIYKVSDWGKKKRENWWEKQENSFSVEKWGITFENGTSSSGPGPNMDSRTSDSTENLPQTATTDGFFDDHWRSPPFPFPVDEADAFDYVPSKLRFENALERRSRRFRQIENTLIL